MRTEIFRKTSNKLRQDRLLGEVLLLPQISHVFVSYFLIAWTLLFFIFILTCHFKRKETVLGWLEPPSGISYVYTNETGIVKNVLVEEGEHVVDGQPLFIVDNEKYLSTGNSLTVVLGDEIEKQRKFVTNQIHNAENLFNDKRRSLSSDLAASVTNQKLLKERIKTIEDQLRLINEKILRTNNLMQSGYVSKNEAESFLSQKLAFDGNRHEVEQLLAEQVASAERIKVEMDVAKHQYDDTVVSLEAKLSELTEDKLNQDGIGSRTIRSPRTGIVANLQLKQGQTIRLDAAPLLAILPNDIKLRASLLAPVRSIGQINPGQRVRIKYDAFPYRKYGLYSGTVQSSSATVYAAGETINSPFSIKEPAYLLKVSLDEDTVRGFGSTFNLRPGMTLMADVELEDRTILQWLLEPIYALRGSL